MTTSGEPSQVTVSSASETLPADGTPTEPIASGNVSPTAASTVTSTLAGGAEPARGIDALADSWVELAVSAGVAPSEARQAGDAFNEALVLQLSKGATMQQALAHAEKAFDAGVSFPPPSPAAVVKSVLAGSGDVAKQLTSLANASTAAGSAAFDKSLASAMAKGASPTEALASAQSAARQADFMAAADTSPRSRMANGNGIDTTLLANRPAGFQKALDAMLAKGMAPEQALQRAELLTRESAQLAQVDAGKPASAVANGTLDALPKGVSGGSFDKTLSSLLARGMSMEQALQRAGQVDAFEREAVVAEARSVSYGFATGRQLSQGPDPVFDRALANAIARGESPEQALQSAQRSAAQPRGNPKPADALASGDGVESLLLGDSNSRTYRTALSNALARGLPLDQALALAKRAEQANAFRYRLPADVAQKMGSKGVAPQVTTSNGKPLPGWLKFSPESGEFMAHEVPEGELPLTVVMQVGDQRYRIKLAEGPVQ